jgi:ABC-type glucose/galactose transport system permease subunit
MFFNSNAFRVTAFIFILTTILISIIKPSLFFDSEGHSKIFGLNYDDRMTPLPFGVFIYGFLAIIYLLIVFIDSKLTQCLRT